ncbi:MAG: antibiotic biosynthesis monooxygenase [Acidimicrobiaceae bacterium]|nr:antibiotic biosynthesis monooxygenase [Acidimicrobiaceae bacterium]MBO0746889.1 antibiotic biosynthesis monooxygenase [Acidimicrobiaceae bacterium]
MQAIFVTVKIKPELRDRFLEVIEHDATASVRDEPGCLRFEVLQDASDPDTYYFFEVYADEAAINAHRETPHFATWDEASKELLQQRVQRLVTVPVFPLTTVK